MISCAVCPFKNDIFEKINILLTGEFIVIKLNYLYRWHALLEEKFNYNNMDYKILLLENKDAERRIMVDSKYKKNMFCLNKLYVEEIFNKTKNNLLDIVAIRYLCNCKEGGGVEIGRDFVG